MRHPKPTGPLQCPHKKAAVLKCQEQGGEDKDYLLFLPDLTCPAEEGKVVTDPTLSPGVKESDRHILQGLVIDSLSSQTELKEANVRIDKLSSQVSELTSMLKYSLGLGDANGAVGGSSQGPLQSGGKSVAGGPHGQLAQQTLLRSAGETNSQPYNVLQPGHLLSTGQDRITQFTTSVQAEPFRGVSQGVPWNSNVTSLQAPPQWWSSFMGSSASAGLPMGAAGVPAGAVGTAEIPGTPQMTGSTAGAPLHHTTAAAVAMAAAAGGSTPTPVTTDPRLPWPALYPCQQQYAWMSLGAPSTKAKRKCVIFDLEPHLTCDH